MLAATALASFAMTQGCLPRPADRTPKQRRIARIQAIAVAGVLVSVVVILLTEPA